MMPMRARAEQWDFCVRIIVAGLVFWVFMELGDNPMPSYIYGDLALMVQAEAWASGFIGFALLTGYGILINGRWRWSPIVRVVGVFGLTALFSLLAISAFAFGGEIVIWLFNAMFFIPKCLSMLCMNVLDVKGRWRERHAL